MVPHRPRNTRPCMSDVAKAFFPKEYAQREQEQEEVQRNWDKIRLNSIFPNTASPHTLLFDPEKLTPDPQAQKAVAEAIQVPERTVERGKILVPVLSGCADLRPWWKKFPQQ